MAEVGYEAYKKLMAAVVGLALKDACVGFKGKSIGMHTVSAFDFLFKHSDGYLELLDLDVQRFRTGLLKYVGEPLTRGTKTRTGDRKLPYNLSDFQCRNFRNNYRKWIMLPASYGPDMWLEEEDEDEDEDEDEAQN